MTIQEKNIVIAEFMGMTEQPLSVCGIEFSTWQMAHNDPNFIYLNGHEDLNFHSDYNWLMKAWVKFRDLNMFDDFYRHKNRIENCLCNRTISEAFEALYEAINWLNSLKK